MKKMINNTINRTKTAATALLATLVSVHANAFTVTVPSGGNSQSPEVAVQNLWSNVESFLEVVGGIILVLYLLIIAFLFIKGDGDGAKKHGTYWVCGGVIFVCAYGIVGWLAK